MDPSLPSSDFVTWLVADGRRALLWVLLVLLPLGHRRLSVWVGTRPRPEPGERGYLLLHVLGILSGAVRADVPGSVKPILGPMPPGRLTPAGGYRAGDTPPQGSGAHPRISTPGGGVVGALLGGLLLLCGACGPSAYVRGMQAAGVLQEESVKRQGEEQDGLLKAGWFLCNRWTDRYHRAGQGVLDARGDVARGVAGAAERQSKAETLADKLARIYKDHCALARDTSLSLKGVAVDPAAAPAAPPATPAAPPAPAAPAPAVP